MLFDEYKYTHFNFRRLPENSIVNEIIIVTSAMAIVLHSVAANSCTARPIMMSIRFENCRVIERLARACDGTCNSYARPSIRNPGQFEYSCSCCSVVTYRRRVMNLTCISRDDVNHRINRRTIVKIPRTCQCRPCFNSIGSVTPAETNIWNQRKRSISYSAP